MTNTERIQANNAELHEAIEMAENLPDVGESGGGSVGTCTVSIILPEQVCIFGWGTYDASVSFDNGANWTALGTALSLPSVEGSSHSLPFLSKRIFANLPVGSTFTFWSEQKPIIEANHSNTIEFSMANHLGVTTSNYNFAMCKCNGDGEITIKI